MTRDEAIWTLHSPRCQCGAPKVRRVPFCGQCYDRLTDDLRRGLWPKIGRGFEAGYEAALEFLRHDTR